MNEIRRISPITLEAYDILLQHRIIEITKALEWRSLDWNSKKEGWIFECNISVPHPNSKNIPSTVCLQVLILDGFPLTPVEFYSITDEVKGFPHQDAESGKLCLPEERLAPRNAERLVHYVNWAKEWLVDAANGNLLKPGDPYELPDFSCKLLPDSYLNEVLLLFNEDNQSYNKWKDNIGKFGVVECFFSRAKQQLYAMRLFDKNTKVVRESKFAKINLDPTIKINGIWLIVPDIRYKHHRPPQTYSELNELCKVHSLSFYDVLKQAWKIDNDQFKKGVILIGFPIPKTYGQEIVEIHWQPLIFSNLKASLKVIKGSKQSRKPHNIWKAIKNGGYFDPSEKLPWGRAQNVTYDRMYERGSYSAKIKSLHIGIFGCGAIGSVIAESLVRSGCGYVKLFDPDTLQLGNLCRHVLDGSYLGRYKAEALAEKLSSINPFSDISGYKYSVPISFSSHVDDAKILTSVDLIIDCTTSESAFEWLSQYSFATKKRMISLFFNFKAEILTLLISGIKTSCSEVDCNLRNSVNKGILPINSEEYLYQPSKEEQIIEGAGCWHPTFPALYAHIQILAAIALDIIDTHINDGKDQGLAAIIKRNGLKELNKACKPLVELLWAQQYP